MSRTTNLNNKPPLGTLIGKRLKEIGKQQKWLAQEARLVDSLNPKQKKWFEAYQEMVSDALVLAERRRFVCGFKTAMRLALESMK